MKGSSTHNMLKVKAGPGYSAGKTPPAVTKGQAAHPKASSGNSVPKGAKPGTGGMGGGMKAGNSNMMRKPYK